VEISEADWYDLVAHTDLVQTLVLQLVHQHPQRGMFISGLAHAVRDTAEKLLAMPVPDAQIAALDREGQRLLALLRAPTT